MFSKKHDSNKHDAKHTEYEPIINTLAHEDYGTKEIEKEVAALVTPRPLKRRWIVLLSFFFLSILNNLMQYSFTSINDVTTQYYKISSLRLNILAMVFMITGFTTRFGAMWMIDSVGMGISVYVATILNLAGAWLRFWPGSWQGSEGYPWLLAGQTLCAVAQSFIDITAPKLAANWFPPRERATATAIGEGAIFVSALISYASVPRIITEGSQIPYYLFVEAALSTFSALLIGLFFRSKPPIPPSYSAAAAVITTTDVESSESGGQPHHHHHAIVEQPSFLQAMIHVAKNRNFILLALTFAITIGTGIAFSVVLDEVVAPYHYSNKQAGLMATVWLACAVAGGGIGGIVVDRTRAYKTVILAGLILITCGLSGFTAMLLLGGEKKLPELCALIGVIGLGASSLPALLEATVETCYPVPEATAMGLLFLGLNVMAIVLTLGMSQLRNPRTGSYEVPLILSIGVCVVGCVLASLIRPDYKRLQFERHAKDQKKHESHRSYRSVSSSTDAIHSSDNNDTLSKLDD